MVYLVVGFPRSGTSMLMRALDAGGIPAIHDAGRGDAVRRNSTMLPGYDPNPHGFYEIEDLRAVDWRRCEGRCVKVIRDNLIDCVPPGGYRAVYMTRDPAEIRRSYPGTMSGPPTDATFDFLRGYWETVAADVGRLESLGAAVARLHYPAVVAGPLAAFARLAAAGWPIDPAAAAATVDPALYRYRGGV